MRTLAVTILVFVLLIGLSPAWSVSLVPGTYKLEWDSGSNGGDDLNRYSFGTDFCTLSEVEEDRIKTKLPPLVSSHPLLSLAETYPILLDESKGTGTGYDALYIKHWHTSSVLDMTDAVEYSVVRREDKLEPENHGEVSVEVRTDGVGRKLKLKVSVDVSRDHTSGKVMPQTAWVTVLGGWYGTIKADADGVGIQTIDANGNGLYNDRLPNRMWQLADSLNFIYSATDECHSGVAEVGLGKAVLFDHNYYSVDVSKSGDEVTVRPYSGPTGRLLLDARDGRGKKAQVDFLNFPCQTSDLRFNTIPGNRVTLPAATYGSVWALLACGNVAQIALDVQRKMVVSDKRDTTITVGGPLKMSIESASAAKIGSTLHIRFPITAGRDKVAGFNKLNDVGTPRGGRITLACKDARGKTVSSCTMPLSWGCDTEYDLAIGKQWRPGRYTLSVSLAAKPYAPSLVYARKTIMISK